MKSLLQEPYPTLAGFDFPIGVPADLWETNRVRRFPRSAGWVRRGGWSDFYHVCRRADDISLNRPFYPNAGNGSPTQRHLVEALGVSDMNALTSGNVKGKQPPDRPPVPYFGLSAQIK